jgi:hypothetical protein
MSSDSETEASSARQGGEVRLVLVAFCDEAVIPFELPPAGGAVTVGRGDGCELRVDHPSVSRAHARFNIGAVSTVEDLDSRNGTRVRGIPISSKHLVSLQPGDVVECGDVLLLLRALPADGPTAALPAGEALAASRADVIDLLVGGEGRWFQPVGGARVNLGRRGPLRRVLLKLAEQRRASPGAGLPVEALLEAGWPGETMQHDSGLARVYTTIQRLRALGLASVLITRDDGYLLEPAIPVRFVEE